jgi:hypothetical protein
MKFKNEILDEERDNLAEGILISKMRNTKHNECDHDHDPDYDIWGYQYLVLCEVSYEEARKELNAKKTTFALKDEKWLTMAEELGY